jgi:hypothetical protein
MLSPKVLGLVPDPLLVPQNLGWAWVSLLISFPTLLLLTRSCVSPFTLMDVLELLRSGGYLKIALVAREVFPLRLQFPTHRTNDHDG